MIDTDQRIRQAAGSDAGATLLVRTHWIDPATIQQAVWKMPPSDDREEKRSETYPGIAFEIARQWGGDLVRQAAE